jgi:hypothetical protein
VLQFLHLSFPHSPLCSTNEQARVAELVVEKLLTIHFCGCSSMKKLEKSAWGGGMFLDDATYPLLQWGKMRGF